LKTVVQKSPDLLIFASRFKTVEILTGTHVKKRVNGLALSGLLGLIFFLPFTTANTQELPRWDVDSIKNSVITLLHQYQSLHNQLNSDSGIEGQRAFVHLFSSPKVLVVNDFEEYPTESRISVLDYASRVVSQYPDGFSIVLNMNGLSVSRPKYDRNNRYLVQARLEKSSIGISAGRVLSIKHRIRVTVGFTLDDGRMSDFLIWGIDLPAPDENYIGFQISPGFGIWRNKELLQDSRFKLKPGPGYRAGIHYAHFFNPRWGLKTGLQVADYHGFLELDRFDPVGPFNPNMREVTFDQHLWFLELPLGLAFKSELSKRTGFILSAGGIAGLRLFESLATSAVNINSGQPLEGVISDPDWIGGLTRMNYSLYVNAGISWLVLPKLSLAAEFEFVRGISPLDRLYQPDFSSTRYLGQYNPILKSEISETYSQMMMFSISVVWVMNFSGNK
jgi:hypothetical protein